MKNYWGDKDKIWHQWVRRGRNLHAKYGNIEITRGFSPYRWNITFGTSAINFLT